MSVFSKISITLLPVCLVSMLYFFKDHPPQECHSNIRTYIETPHGNIRENINVNIIFDDGFYNVVGTIETKDNHYIVHREGYFSKDDLHKSRNFFKIKKETLFIDDNTPSEIWEKTSLPRPYNIPFYFIRAHLKTNLVLYSSLSNPLFVCAGSK